jgi:hypothetical protein
MRLQFWKRDPRTDEAVQADLWIEHFLVNFMLSAWLPKGEKPVPVVAELRRLADPNRNWAAAEALEDDVIARRALAELEDTRISANPTYGQRGAYLFTNAAFCVWMAQAESISKSDWKQIGAHLKRLETVLAAGAIPSEYRNPVLCSILMVRQQFDL